MARVYSVSEDGSSSEMKRVHVQNEDLELQRILEKNHDLLPGDQMDPETPRQWLLIKREMPVPDPASGQTRWKVDFLFADQDAVPTFVECKRFNDTRARREVIGQMIEYAANGHRYWSKELLRDLAEQAAKSRGLGLEDAVTALVGTDSDGSDEFFNHFEENLRDGKLRLVFFLEESPAELRSLVEFLNKQMERTEVLLVEARQFVLDSKRIVVPSLFGYTEEARQIKRPSAALVAASRRRWDEAKFFADAQERLGEKAAPLRNLYDRLNQEELFALEWGTGSKQGSFNPKVYAICPRSLITVYSGGGLQLNFDWLPDPVRAKLTGLFSRDLGLAVPPQQKFPSYAVTEWGQKVDALVKGLVRMVSELRRPADTAIAQATGRSGGSSSSH